MNNRAALKAMLKGEYPEEVCQFEWGYWPETVARWKSEGMPADKDPWEAAGITRYDRVPVNVRFCPPLEAKVLRETEDTQIILDEEGVTKEISKHGTAFPRFLHHPVETPEDFAAHSSPPGGLRSRPLSGRLARGGGALEAAQSRARHGQGRN